MAPIDPVQPSITATLFVALQFLIRLYDGRKGTPTERVEQLEEDVASLKRSNSHRRAEIEELSYQVRVLQRAGEASG